jgi:carbonic anhydrase/acetyltransferase-like protein (isoleucine patch superfamily)
MIRSFRGNRPKIAENAFISEAAYIIGDVEIGEHSSVWPGAVIRGDFGKIIIGRNSAIEDNAVIHAGSPGIELSDLIIGDSVHIGHGAVVNGKKIGNHVLIGINATILHEAVIGDFCILGAGCMVGQGMKIPGRSFVVGVPARIKGEVTDEQLWWVKQAPKDYLKLAEEYKKEKD